MIFENMDNYTDVNIPVFGTTTNFKNALITFIFLLGAAANLIALWIIHKSARTRNRKHVFLLRCLACNDLVAQIGMLVTLYSEKKGWTCVVLVLLRGFGIGSGCVAFVMALERWLALTRPFVYHQKVTYRSLRIFTGALWGGAQLLTNLVLFGFGVYYKINENNEVECVNYKLATELKDVTYAYLFFAFGTVLCICIALCNVTVVLELLRIRSQNRVFVRRVSKSTINRSGIPKYQTPEEIAFAKLMAIICLIFMICWVPQLVSTVVSLNSTEQKKGILFKIANLLMCVYFATDPFVYVLQRYKEVWKFVFPCCFFRSTDSITTTATTTVGTPTSVLLKQPSFTIPVEM